MFKLNLLPPAEKKELKLTELNNLILSLAGQILILLLIFNLFLGSTFFCLSILLKEQKNLIAVKESNPQMQDLLEIEEKIKQTNQIIKQVNLGQTKAILWTPVFEEITKIVSNDIYLTNFSYQSDSNLVTLNGWANQRENLLYLQKLLEENSFFKEVKVPLSNLIKEKNIDFNLAFGLK
ncbi:MAG: hypothetical protein COS49_02355 [Candidatus Portnoybacteria bacterium CG03_land_8_20_14_0_80_41_10]|uniref:PilN domain-containing protein n=1 Tax=Candidatus Portnoybacteria bacterium CG03_land_8_20_14_0_80_41_10 TaxID=1974808 RepID=A0A2M7BU52_9BACT|nr:MAG: hypothetical protein COS49_02355 [Candidatus Portnoybacteria bacterium CG03_land_8_20_14_0_80_41_10]